MKFSRLLTIALILLASSISFPQKTTPESIVENVRKKFYEVEDYQVDVKINVDVDFLKVPETKAKIFFRQPDKIKFNSEGFALLPREGLNFSPLTVLQGDFTSLLEKEDLLDGKNVYVIKIIPLGGASEVILTTLWIDKKDFIIYKVESTTKMNGTFYIDLKYEQKNSKYPLPSSLVFTFDISRTNLPTAIAGGYTGSKKDEKESPRGKKKNKLTKGTVTISYSNYIINKGIDDSIFEERKK